MPIPHRGCVVHPFLAETAPKSQSLLLSSTLSAFTLLINAES